MFSCNLPPALLAEWPGFFTCYCGNTGGNGYRNKSQHRKSTLEKEILPPFQQGFEPATFQSRVQCSNHWAIPAPPRPLFMFFVIYPMCWVFHFQATVWVNSYPHFLYLCSCSLLCFRWQYGITNCYPLLSTFPIPLFMFLVMFQMTVWDNSYPLLSTFSVPLFMFLVMFQVTVWDNKQLSTIIHIFCTSLHVPCYVTGDSMG